MHTRPYTLGSFAAGCVGLMALGAVMLTGPGCSSPPPPPATPSSEAVINTPTPASTPMATASSNTPGPAEVAASRPKQTPDPFNKNHASQGGVAIAPVATPTTASSPSASKTPKATKTTQVAVTTPSTPSAPPPNPGYTAVGIFRSSKGPEAIIATKSGTEIVSQGAKLPDGGVVKSIDVDARKVVIDKENYDFVLPLEAPAAGTSGPGALPPPPAPSGK